MSARTAPLTPHANGKSYYWGDAVHFGETACIISQKQFGNITDRYIYFGVAGSNSNICGLHKWERDKEARNDWYRPTGMMEFGVGARQENSKFSITKSTGIFVSDQDVHFQCKELAPVIK